MSGHHENARGASLIGIVLSLGVLGALGLGWWMSFGRSAAAAGVDPDRVVVVERKDLVDGVTASGRVEPRARVAVMSRASGIVKELFAEEGDVVAQGQVLAELDREQLEAQLAQDQAELASAEARVAASLARVEEARTRLDDPELAFWEREYARLVELYSSGDVTLKQRDDAERTLAATRFRVIQVRASLPVLEAAVREAEADLLAAKASLERSQTTLREATIRSPIDGVLLVRLKEVGDGVSSILTAGGNATELMTLGDLSEMYVDARVDEVDLGRIQVGMPALVTVDAHRGKTLDGAVARIAPAGSVDENGIVTFEVRVTVEDPDGLLKPDMTADARLVVARREGVPTLPQRAFARDEQGRWIVRKVEGEGPAARAVPTVVELGLSDGLITEVATGAVEGERVLLPEAGAARGGGRP